MDLPLQIHELMAEIRALAKSRFEHARVQAKVNARGELVIGVIVPPRIPGEWAARAPDAREEKRRARERR
jgi:hypothetical protein